MAAEPDLAPLLSELVDNSDGQEIYLRRPERYGLDSNKPTSFSHVGLATHHVPRVLQCFTNYLLHLLVLLVKLDLHILLPPRP